MRLKKLRLKDIRNFQGVIEFDFSTSKEINVVSGKNGSGKTTIFKSIHLCQKIFFYYQIEDNSKLEQTIASQLAKLFLGNNSWMELTFDIKKDEEDNSEAKFKIKTTNYSNDLCSWEIEITDEDETQIKKYWNIDKPKNIVIYVPSDKHFIEKDIEQDKISIQSAKGYDQLLLDTILYPEQIFSNFYNRLVSDYIRERLLPSKPRVDLYFKVTEMMLKSLLPQIELSKFSGLHFENQFVLLGKTSRGRGVNHYDIRNFSSGEKVAFYILLFINYVQQIGMLIIDEPENHFHEDLLIKFISHLAKVCKTTDYVKFIKNVASQNRTPINQSAIKNYIKFYKDYDLEQVYLLSHSKNLIYSNFHDGQNYYVNNGLKTIDYENYESVLREIGISSIYSKVLFVEGDMEEQYLSLFLSDYNIKVHSLNGCHQVIETFKKISNLKEYIRESHFCFLIDRDTMSMEEIEKIREADTDNFDKNFIILEKHEFENYLLEPKIFHEIIKQHSALFQLIGLKTEQEIATEIKEIADETKEHLYRKEIQKLNGYSIGKIYKIFRRRDLPVTSEDEFKSYATTKLNEANLQENIISDFVTNFNVVKNKYRDEVWDDKWLEICDGKIVLGQVVGKYASYLSIGNQRLRQEIKKLVLDNSGYEINTVIRNIINKYE